MMHPLHRVWKALRRCRSLGHYIESMEFDAQTYTDTKERLDTINKCKTKYGNTISEILAYAQNQQEFLHKYDDFEQYKIKLQEELAQQKETLLALCQKASKIRCKEDDSSVFCVSV